MDRNLATKRQVDGFVRFGCRWDRVSLQRLLTKLMSAPTLLTPAPSTKGLSPLAKALSSMPDPEKEDKGVHPQHVRIALDRESKSILGKPADCGYAESMDSITGGQHSPDPL